MDAPGPIPHIDNTTFVADKAHRYQGRHGYPVRLLVLHNTEGTGAGNAPSGMWLSRLSPQGQSAHHLYGRDGTRYDLVTRADTAYHAGVSAWGIYRGSVDRVSLLNLVSIGHELESTSTLADPGNGYTAAQLYSLSYTLACELYGYGLQWETAVLRHAQIALPSGRRHDPSHFDPATIKPQVDAWRAFFAQLAPADVPKWII